MSHNHTYFRVGALAVTAILAALALGLAACSQRHEASRGEPAVRTPAGGEHATEVDPNGDQGADLRVRVAGVRLDRAARAQVVSAARRFATSLAGWLYGDRGDIAVQAVSPEVRRQLANAPPYVPPDQIGSGDAQVVQGQVSVQTPRSGVLVVTIRDSRTTYEVPATFERRAGRWQVVHLSAD